MPPVSRNVTAPLKWLTTKTTQTSWPGHTRPRTPLSAPIRGRCWRCQFYLRDLGSAFKHSWQRQEGWNLHFEGPLAGRSCGILFTESPLVDTELPMPAPALQGFKSAESLGQLQCPGTPALCPGESGKPLLNSRILWQQASPEIKTVNTYGASTMCKTLL